MTGIRVICSQVTRGIYIHVHHKALKSLEVSRVVATSILHTMGVQRSYTPLMLTLTIGLVFQFVFSSVLMEPCEYRQMLNIFV